MSNYFSYQVYKFVGLNELYYAGSHGMDIMGPVRQSIVDNPRHGIRSTEKQVIISHNVLYVFIFLSDPLLQPFSLWWIQGKDVNLFQPAAEFLPMISEVRKISYLQ